MKYLHLARCCSLLAILGTLGQASSALASGFALIEQSVPGLGNAFAGSAATAEDPSTIFFNPAGLTRLQGTSATGAAYGIFPGVRFKRERAVTVTGSPLTGGDGGDAGVNVIAPNAYAAWSLSDRLKLGIGVNAPFGLATQYPSTWVGRYQAVESRLVAININPTVAYKLTDTVSLGAGLNIQQINAVLSNAIDFGVIGLGAGLGTLPQSADGFVKVVGNDWSLGYNLGVLYEPSQTTRLGLAYRSAITHNIRGKADFTVPTAFTPLTSATGLFTDSKISSELKLPDSLSLAAYHQLSPRVAIMGDVSWTNWSRFRELRINFDNPAQPDAVQPENWRDTYRIGLGISYAATNALTLRAGVAYDQTPVKDEFRTARLPDGSRVWLAVGASYRPSQNFSLDIGYSHQFVGDVPFEQGSAETGFLKGSFNDRLDTVAVQMNWRF